MGKGRKACEAAILALKNANAAVRNGMQQFEEQLEKENFKLDPRNKDDLPKIQKARKLLIDAWNGPLKILDYNDKTLDELNKHLIQAGGYKQKPVPLP